VPPKFDYNDTEHFPKEKNRAYYFKKVKEVWTLSEEALFLLPLFRFNHTKMPKEATDIKMIFKTLRKTKKNLESRRDYPFS